MGEYVTRATHLKRNVKIKIQLNNYNAYLTKEGAPVEEPTEKSTSIAPTEAPTETLTSIATENPTEEITDVPTETATVATEISTEVVKPTSATQQMHTSVPTSATHSGTNGSGTSGIIQVAEVIFHQVIQVAAVRS